MTIEAPRGTVADLAPYSGVTDVHGVDIYPVSLAHPDPDLHAVGRWTATLTSISPQSPVWTTIQICASGSVDKVAGNYVVPTYQQERYMAYDAILNGAKALTFFGGNNSGCFSAGDATYGWNWSFWQSVLEPVVQQLSASSPIAPALVNAAKAAETWNSYDIIYAAPQFATDGSLTSPARLTEEALRDSFRSLKHGKHYARSASTMALCGITCF